MFTHVCYRAEDKFPWPVLREMFTLERCGFGGGILLFSEVHFWSSSLKCGQIFWNYVVL